MPDNGKAAAIERLRRIRWHYVRIVSDVRAYATEADARELREAEAGVRRYGIDPESIQSDGY